EPLRQRSSQDAVTHATVHFTEERLCVLNGHVEDVGEGDEPAALQWDLDRVWVIRYLMQVCFLCHVLVLDVLPVVLAFRVIEGFVTSYLLPAATLAPVVRSWPSARGSPDSADLPAHWGWWWWSCACRPC